MTPAESFDSMSKYDPLRFYLEGLRSEQWRATFDKIEKVLGFRLPASARDHPAWWANENETETRHPQKLAWVKARWRTANLNLIGETIEFVRERETARERKATPATVWAERPHVWLDDVLKDLAAQRPVFHSEADFQHALAWAIHEADPDIPIRLEYKPLLDERLYLDVWLGREPPIAIELKYATRSLDVTVSRERFILKDQAAQDWTRYDFLKDVTRLERIATVLPGASGFALLLTNDHLYWRCGGRPDTVDAAFRLHEGRKVSGELRWLAHAGAGTTSGREQPIDLRARYDLAWRPYSNVGAGAYSELRYLLVAVG